MNEAHQPIPTAVCKHEKDKELLSWFEAFGPSGDCNDEGFSPCVENFLQHYYESMA